MPLRIFESRYVDMISRCMRETQPFGVVLITQGSESGQSRFSDIGTTAEIIDWYQGSDGLLGVTALGRERFRVLESRREADGLNVGTVEILPGEPRQAMNEHDRELAEMLERVLEQPGTHYDSIEKDYGDAGWVSYRLAEILPLSLELKQRCLEQPAAQDRLAFLRTVLDGIKVV